MKTLAYCCMIVLPAVAIILWTDDRQKLHEEIDVAERQAVLQHSALTYPEVEARVREHHDRERWW